MGALAGLLGFGLFVGLIVAVYVGGRWILGPIDRAAKRRISAPRITISDCLCLFVAVQLPLAFIRRIRSDETEVHFWIFMVLSWIIAPVIWISCARALSRGGITGGVHRFLFMALVLPIAYYGLVPFVLLTAAAAIQIVFGEGGFLLSRPWWIVGWLATGTAIVAAGSYTHWLCGTAGPGMASLLLPEAPEPTPCSRQTGSNAYK
jgi:hypothetical protein